MENLKKLLEDNGGKLPAYAWPGGYPLLYLDGHNEVLCALCATKALLDPDEDERDKPQAYDVYYEGADEHCAECNVVIESAYGDPEEEEQ